MQHYFLLLPCLISLFWFLGYLLMSPSSPLHRRLEFFFAVCSLYLFMAFFTYDDFGQRYILHFYSLGQMVSLSITPVLIAYLDHFSKGRKHVVMLNVCWTFPFVHILMCMETVFVAGYVNALPVMHNIFDGLPPFTSAPDRAMIVFVAAISYVYKAFVMVGVIFFITRMALVFIKGGYSLKDLFMFYFRGGQANTHSVQYSTSLIMILLLVVMVVLGKGDAAGNPWVVLLLCVLASFVLSMIGLVGTVGPDSRQSVKSLLDRLRFRVPAYVQQEKAAEPAKAGVDMVVKQHADQVIQSSIYGSSAASQPLKPLMTVEADELVLFGQNFEKCVLYDRLFLEQGISLYDISEKLGVKKEFLADFIGETYGMTFLNYISMLRVDYSIQFILDHPDATQKEIANACGYPSAPAFNAVFRKVTGITPKIWTDRYTELKQRNDINS